jgi:hypothetical protein
VSGPLLGGVAIAGVCWMVLVGSLLVAALIMRRISRRLAALHDALCSIGAITDPLPDRVAGIGGNVRNLREAATALSQLVSSRNGGR